MDCKDINARLIEVVKEANWCRDRLAAGDTGTGFDLSLKIILLHINTIRAQIDTVRA